MMSEDNGGYGFVAGFFLGTTLGAVTALLLAPMTGREVRRTLMEERRKLRVKTDQAVAEIRAKGDEILERTRKAASQTAGGVSEAARTIKGS
jgi:gas vesicle protein